MPTDSPGSPATGAWAAPEANAIPGTDSSAGPVAGSATGSGNAGITGMTTRSTALPGLWSRIRTSLAGRMALATTAVALLAVVTIGAVAWPLIRDTGLSQARSQLGQQADLAAFVLSRPDDSRRATEIGRLQTDFDARGIAAEVVRFPVSDADRQRATALGLTDAELQSLAVGNRVSSVADLEGERILIEGRPVWVERFGPGSGRDDDDENRRRAGPPAGAVLLSQPVSAADAAVASTLQRLAWAMVIGLGLAALVGWLLARRLARPLQRAAAAAERMSVGDRNVQVTPEGPTEVADVALALNRLNQALIVSEARQRDFLLSVSHELRTPMTSIRGYAEALADGVVPDQDVPRTAAVMASESERLDMLVADLLELARLGAVQIPINLADVDLVELVRGAGEVWQDRCEDEGLTFALELPDGPVPIRTDPLRVRQIIDNLAANALRVTPQGRPLVIALRKDGADQLIEVRDGGPGLTADDCSVAFEPAELHSRYRGIRKVGSGVGLALVGRLARLLGGTAEAGMAEEGGARFTVRLPTSPAPDLASP